MQRLAVIASLKPDSGDRAAELIAQGPPFNPKDVGFERHAIYLTSDHIVFMFEGGNLNQLLSKVMRNPSSSDTFGNWERIIEGMPRVAREVYSWKNGEDWPETWGE